MKKILCDRGHLMAETRKVDTKGRGYCGVCKESRRKEYRNSKREFYKKYHANYSRVWNLKVKYGITIEQFEEMKTRQNNTCAICKTTECGGRFKEWHIDHNRTTNQVRGLLCTSCNLAVGLIKDNEEVAQSMSKYLKDFRERFNYE